MFGYSDSVRRCSNAIVRSDRHVVLDTGRGSWTCSRCERESIVLWGFGDITPREATGIQPVPDPLPYLPTYGSVMTGLSGLGQEDDTPLPSDTFNAPIPGNVNIGPTPGFAIPTTVSTPNTGIIQDLQSGIAYRDALLAQTSTPAISTNMLMIGALVLGAFVLLGGRR